MKNNFCRHWPSCFIVAKGYNILKATEEPIYDRKPQYLLVAKGLIEIGTNRPYNYLITYAPKAITILKSQRRLSAARGCHIHLWTDHTRFTKTKSQNPIETGAICIDHFLSQIHFMAKEKIPGIDVQFILNETLGWFSWGSL